MILAIDIGNTNIVLGCVEGKKTFFIERLSTDKAKTELEYAVSLKNVLEIYEIPVDQIEGGIISSVVPQVTELCRSAAEKVIKKPVKVVGPGVKTGLNIKLDDPATAGSDLVVVAVAALNEYTCPQIVIDMGTATTMSVLDQKGCFIGGVILPGLRTSLDALVSNAAQLSQTSLAARLQSPFWGVWFGRGRLRSQIRRESARVRSPAGRKEYSPSHPANGHNR